MDERLYKPPTYSPRKVAIGLACAAAICSALVVIQEWIGWSHRGAVGATKVIVLLLIIGWICWGVFRLLLRRVRSARPEKMPFMHFGIAAKFMLAVFVGMSLVASGALRSSLLLNLWIVPFMGGLGLIQAAWARRVGDSLHCPACEYEFNFPDADNAPVRCPECGSGWLGLLCKGRKHRSRKWMAWGAGVCALSVGLMFLSHPVFYLSSVSRHLPTPVLCSLLYASPSGSYVAWDELGTRTLSASWIRRMGEEVIEQRRSGRWTTPGSRWFEVASEAGQIPSQLADRYYREAFAAELHVPVRVRAGEMFDASLRVKHVMQGSKHNLCVYFGGYTIADEAPVGRIDQSIWAHEMSSVGIMKRHRDVATHRSLAPSTPGKASIRATYWVVHVPTFNDGLRWGADGVPIVPPDAVYVQRIDVERWIEVLP